MKRVLLATISVFTIASLFIGCGSDSSTGDTPSAATTMIINTAYSVTTNSVVTKTSSDANISVDSSLSDGTTAITLISGTATCTECTKL
jgi:hypothetical protein